ncbi:MAG: BlaI/MecI/CopY family transcriptional regulator [Bacteroidia bacterium]|nr:BlaI/MecI/CopY family transcriptional regulator [Bacteroidia bacterium]
MQKLAKREEQIMQALWKLEKAFIKEIIAELPDQPHYNTVATIIKVLQKKGFVSSESFGNAHRYYPVLSRDNYQQQEIGNFIKHYFNDSYKNLVAYFAEEEKINEAELKDIIELIKKNKS